MKKSSSGNGKSSSIGGTRASSIFFKRGAKSLDQLDDEKSDQSSSDSESSDGGFAFQLNTNNIKRQKKVQKKNFNTKPSRDVEEVTPPAPREHISNNQSESGSPLLDLTDESPRLMRQTSMQRGGSSNMKRSRSNGSKEAVHVSDPSLIESLKQIQDLAAQAQSLTSSSTPDTADPDVIIMSPSQTGPISVNMRFEKNAEDVIVFRIKQEDKLQKLFSAYKDEKREVHPDSVEYSFLFDGLTLLPNQTIKEALLSDGDTIEVGRTGDSALLPLNDAPVVEAGDKIAVKFRGPNNTTPFTASVAKNEKWKSILEKLIQKRGLNANTKFKFDGDFLPPEQTPEDLDMEDEDIVEYS